MNYQSEMEQETFEGLFNEFTFEGELDMESPFSEAEEMELASELLEVRTDAELDQFLGKLIKSAGKAVTGFVRSPIGKKIGGFLKGAAKVALPIAGKVAGGFFGGPVGGMIGGKLGSMASNLFEINMEGMNQEEMEFEMARKFVRFGGAAAKKGASFSPRVPSAKAARMATVAAARQHAPGLLRKKKPGTGGGGTCRSCGSSKPGITSQGSAGVRPDRVDQGLGATPSDVSGRWVRRGSGISLLNCYGGPSSAMPPDTQYEPEPQGDGGDEEFGPF